MDEKNQQSKGYASEPAGGLDKNEVNRIEASLRKQGIPPLVVERFTHEQLNGLYSKPKSLDERLADDKARSELFDSRRKKHPALSVALLGGLLFFGGVELAINIESMWFFGQMAGVFLSFSLAILLLFLGYAWYIYSDKVLYSYKVATNMLVWLGIALPVLIISTEVIFLRFFGIEGGSELALIGAVLYFLASFTLIATVIRKIQRKNSSL